MSKKELTDKLIEKGVGPDDAQRAADVWRNCAS
jgi:hypothetical protein